MCSTGGRPARTRGRSVVRSTSTVGPSLRGASRPRHPAPGALIVRSHGCSARAAQIRATILRLARERPELKVVNDQRGVPPMPRPCPSLWKLIACDARGTVHCANDGRQRGSTSPRSDHGGGLRPRRPLHDGRHAPTCPRPQFSVLEKKTASAGVRGPRGSPLRPWEAR